jgi:glycosyltransferase involved in cell wall biosynthesis
VRTLPAGPAKLDALDPVWLSAVLWGARPRVYFSPGFNPPLSSPSPVVFTIHDLIHLRFPQEMSAAKSLYYRAVVRPAARRAAAVLTVSEFSRREIIEWSGVPEGRVVVVGNGAGPEFTPSGPRLEPGYPYLLYVGNEKPHKNLRGALEGFARSGVAADVRLVVNVEAASEWTGLVDALGLGGRVVFAGRIAEDRLASYYRGAVALVFPAFLEGFGIPPLEAMSCGAPVVTSSLSSLPEVVGDAAVFVDPSSVESIASGIRAVVEDEALRERLSTAGLERSRRFSWDRTAGLVRSALERAAQGGA